MYYISIKRQLIGWLGYSFLLITLLAIIAVYLFSNHEINQYFDDILKHESNSIIDRLYVNKSKIIFKQRHLGINLQTSSGDSSLFYSIEDLSGNLIAGFRNIPKTTKSDSNQTYYNAIFFGQEIRALRTLHTMRRNKKSYNVVITIAETLEDRHAMRYKIYFMLALITLLIIISTLICTFYSVNKGLSPLVALQYSIKRRDMHDLAPIKEDRTPIEVIALVQSINQLLKRLKKSFLHVAQFNEDVSHQLRTPLAELRIMIETDDSINEEQKEFYLESIRNMVHTSEQLLLHAHTNPDVYDRINFKPFDLTELCKKVALLKAPILYADGFDIIFEAKKSLWINGVDVIIESLLNNLINNAQKYALSENTTEKNTLTISIHENQNTITMSISDNGPGIPKEYLKKIFNRFFRLDTKKQGTGLGLAIVKQIVELHNGSIELTNIKPHGLNISITFPKVDVPV
ncbi:sensor histidine kinase [Sulfurospirillum arcachonense]|uniref:sensor histidine kinase n=1 Tax=Sulfurospirillum arcachonense TaxID=57666 RepID=UPI000469C76A|nr:sensor histidine kinase [Sulfurospirillum arcachonense]